MFFKKKEPKPELAPTVAEELYKHNLELAVKNKTLSLLDKLYSISLKTLEPRTLASEITRTIQQDMNCELAAVFLLNKEKNLLEFLSSHESDRLKSAETSVNPSFNFPDIELDTSAFLIKILTERRSGYTENLSEIFGPTLKSFESTKISEGGHVRSSLVYPLIVDDDSIGLFILSINRAHSDLANYEKKAIDSFINVISIALDKSLLYKKLTQTNTDLQIANDGQANLIHIMNHQIKGYLSKSRNIFAELLDPDTDYGPIGDAARPMLREGLESLTEGVGFVQQVLHGSAAESGQMIYSMSNFDLKELVIDVADRLKGDADKRGLTYELTIDEGDYHINGDIIQLREATHNLIDNSIRYTLEGGLKIRLYKNNNKILFEVKDTGVGIAPEDKTRLFTKGGRGKDSLKLNVNSTGYGLAFTKAVIEAHKGRVWAESDGPGKGSQFYIELPL